MNFFDCYLRFYMAIPPPPIKYLITRSKKKPNPHIKNKNIICDIIKKFIYVFF